jgi:opacity protein-like surface antigen
MKSKEFRIIVISICMLVSYIHIDAQLDFKPGFIIKEKNDTISGYISYSGKKLFRICTFKRDLNEKPIDYKPSDIIGFGFEEDKCFVAKNIKLAGEEDIYFLEYLFKGKASIYYFLDKNDHYFIEKDDNKIIELTEPEKYIENNNGELVLRQKQYKGKLKAVMLDCEDIFPEIEKTSLTHSSLIKLAKKYHYIVCPDEKCIVYERKIKPIKPVFGIHAGMSLNKLNFGLSLISDYSIGSQIGCKLVLENIFIWPENMNIGIDFTLQFLNNYRLSENSSEYGYESIKYNSQEYKIYHNVNEPNIYNYKTALDVNIKTILLKIPITMNYSFAKTKFKPFVGGGFLNVIAISQNKDLVLARYNVQNQKTIPAYNFGLIGKAGAKYTLQNNHSIYLELNYEWSQNFNSDETLKFSNNSFAFMVGYTL